MFDFLPIEYYTTIYYNILLVLILLVFASAQFTDLSDERNLQNKKVLGIGFLVFVLLYIGLRPISGYFGDMVTYAAYYERYLSGEKLISEADLAFQIFMRWSTTVMPVGTFFFVCACLYILPLYSASKNLVGKYWFYLFLTLVISFSFWGYAVNGIRNGIATTIFIYAISQKSRVLMLLLLALSYMTHNAMMIPLAALGLAYFVNRTNWFLIGWLLCIPLSLVLGGALEQAFSSFFEIERTAGYLTDIEETQNQFSRTGFRWDFLIYSFAGIYTGWYFIYKKKFDDPLYGLLFNTYVIANAFWVLVIRAAFTNRFAYLSWFLMAIVIFYPFLRRKFFDNQHRLIGRLILAYFAFTYIMNILRGNN